MKSKLLYLMIFALAAVSMVGCDDESTAGHDTHHVLS